MSTDLEIFDRVMNEENFGTHYSGVGRLETMMQRKLQGFAQSASTHEPRKVDFPAPFAELSNDPAMNALAFTEEGRDCIMMTTGAVQVFAAFFPTVLSLPGIFPQLEAPGNNAPQPHWDTLPTDAQNLPAATIPGNAVRQAIASGLIAFASDFLILHEIGHVLYGHTRWSGSHPTAAMTPYRRREFSAAINPSSDLESILEDHVCELEADSYAVGTMISNLEGALQGEGAYHSHASAIGWTLEESVKYWLFGIYTFFRLFSNNALDLNNQTAENHPLPIVRLAWIAQRLPGLIHQGTLEPLHDRIMMIALEAADELENAISQLTGRPRQPVDILRQQHPAVDTHLEALLKKLDEIRPELDTVSYIPRT